MKETLSYILASNKFEN